MLIRGAEGHASAIMRERTHWGDPLALLLRAGVAAAREETARAVGLLESAEAGLLAADMALHAAAAQRRRGELMGVMRAGASWLRPMPGWPARASGTRSG